MSTDSHSFGGSIPSFYDDCLGPVLFEDYAIDLARRVSAAAPARVLETAAGSGIVTRRLRDALAPEAELTATDLQQAMLDVARTKFKFGERVEFVTADATALPFPDERFDAVACQFGVMFYPDKDRSYRETYRVLQPGGRYHFSVWDSHRFNAFGRVAHETFRTAFPDDPPPFFTLPFSYGFDAIKDSLIAAGFVNIDVAVLQLTSAVVDVSSFARGVMYGSPIMDQLRARGKTNVDELVRRLTEALAAEFGNPPRAARQALVFSATKA